VPDLGYGLSYPLFNFYSVLPYYIGGFINAVGFDSLIATKIVFVGVIIASGVSMYFLTRKFFGRLPALVSSLLYLYFPYHAVNIYVRGDLAELSAYVFLPLVMLSLFNIHIEEKVSRGNIILGSLSLAAIIISHNLSAFMMFIFAGIFVIYSFLSGKKKKKLLVSYSAVFVLAFLLSAFYAIPAALEAKYTNVLTQIGGGSDYRDHFVCIWQFWNSPWGYGGSAPGCMNDGISFMLGKLNIVLAIFGALATVFCIRFTKEKKGIIYMSLIFLFLAVFMTLNVSFLVWGLPFMDFLQFPWRFLNFVGLFGAFIIGFFIWFVMKRVPLRFTVILSVLIIAATIYSNGKLFVPQEILHRSASFYTNKNYLNWTASKISDEYLPKGFISPKKQEDIAGIIKESTPTNPFFIKNSEGIFQTRQTPLELISNFLSLIGVITLLLVIIGLPLKRRG
jgi:uncharacterized membrane protein